MTINKDYIENLLHTQSKDLQAVAGDQFFGALIDVHTRKKVVRLVTILLEQSDSSFNGVAEFKERLKTAYLQDGALLSVEDQKYLASYINHVQ